jgi:hypothetical protein
MAEAKKRNPKVTTYGLSWAAPGWINNGTDWCARNAALFRFLRAPFPDLKTIVCQDRLRTNTR